MQSTQRVGHCRGLAGGHSWTLHLDVLLSEYKDESAMKTVLVVSMYI